MASTADSQQVALSSGAGRWILATSVLGTTMVFLDSTVVNVALPTIGRHLGASTSALQWILNGYLLTLASLILLGGSLGDRFGRRRVFVIGAGVFTLASLLCSIAPNVSVLVLARLIQGVGGALLTPGSLAMIEASFRPDDRPRAIGAWSGLGGVATAIGPLLGGYLVQAASWRAIFLINLPLGVLVMAMATRHVPETRDPTVRGRPDLPAGVLGGLGLAGTTYALIQGPADGASVLVVSVGLVGLLALSAFVLRERRTANPMLPLDIFRSGQFSAANGVTFVVYAALSGVFFLLVAFLQVSLHYSPLAAGAASLPVTALMLVFSERSGALAQRIGPRIPLTIGPIVVAGGLLLMARITPGDTYVSSVLPAVIVFGVGLTFVVAPVTATALASAGPEHSGVASGVNNAVSRVGGLLAVAILPLIAGITGHQFYDPAKMTSGFRTAMEVSAALSACGGLLAWLTIRSDVLGATEPKGHEATKGVAKVSASNFSCDVAGTGFRPCPPDD